MKATGCVQSVDQNGRLVIPKKLRATLDIEVNDIVEFYVNDKKEIVLKKHVSTCVFCGSTENVVDFKNKKICLQCATQLNIDIEKSKQNTNNTL